MTEERITHPDGSSINLHSWPSSGTPKAVVVLQHGFNAHGGHLSWAAEQLNAAGCACYAVDLRGRGKSDGERFFVDEAKEQLVGTIELPMAVGVVGGATRVHPTVQAARRLLGPFATSATKLAGLMAAVGLAQNTGALKAMVTEGIMRGHMSLHARQVALAAGASAAEVDVVADAMVKEGQIRTARAEELLQQMRAS